MKIKGFNQLVDKLKRLSAGVPKAMETEMEATAFLIVNDAKQNAPVDTGKLRQSIFGEVTRTFRTFSVSVTANAPYAMYIEFGTGGKVDIPAGWGDLAAQYKGKGIKQVNLPAQPYLIPAYNKYVREFMVKLQGEIKQLT